jgi:Uma2 family endonuclease
MSTERISLEEYLHSSYRPDCDYVDGEVQERNFGDFDHSFAQGFVGAWFFQHRREWQLLVAMELRVRVFGSRIRIADLCLIARGQPIEQIPTKPPLAVIEILSPEDRILRYNNRLADYRNMGVKNVWVVDPINKVGYDGSTTAWLPVEEFRISHSPIFFRLGDLWNEMQAIQPGS